MSKRLLIFAIILIAFQYSAKSQTGWGIKASYIYNSNGQLIDEVGNILESKGKGESGFNAGIFGKLDLGIVYIRPELVYSQATSDYIIEPGETESFKMQSIDLPVLVGFRLIGPLNVFVGPAFQYIINSDLKGLNFEEIENDFTVGLNIGLSVRVGRVEIEAKYDRGFTSNEASFIDKNITDTSAFTLDTRQQQIIVGLSYRLSSKKK